MSLHLDEQKRLNRQCREMLARLEVGPATNTELVQIAMNHTGRISDLRAAGYLIDKVSYDRKTGVAVYELRGRIHDGQLPLLRTA